MLFVQRVALLICILAPALPAPARAQPLAASTLRNELAPDIRGLYALPDGTIYLYSAQGSLEVFRGGTRSPDQPQGTVGDGGAICGNSRSLFVTCRGGGLGLSGVMRLSLDGKPSAYLVTGADAKLADRLILPVGNGPIASIAASDTALFVSSPDENIVRVFDPDTMGPTGWFEVDRPGHLAVDGAGRIWVERQEPTTGATTILSYDPSGIRHAERIALPPGAVVQAMAADPARDLLIVADNGPDQNIKIYDTGKLTGSPTKPLHTIGRVAGIYAKRRGQNDASKLNGPCALGVDDGGDLFVGSCGCAMDRTEPNLADGGSLECFSLSDGRLRWKALAVLASAIADMDPAIETDVYTSDRHFLYNYSKPSGQGWSYNGYTLDRFRYPDDPRAIFPDAPEKVWVRHLNGAPYLFVEGTGGGYLAVYRFAKGSDAGEIAIPAVLIVGRPSMEAIWPPSERAHANASDRLVWRIGQDRSGNGHFEFGEFRVLPDFDLRDSVVAVDKLGGIWVARGSSLSHLVVAGFDEMGVPRYLAPRPFPLPAVSGLTDLYSLVYDPMEDALYATGRSGGRNSLARIDSATQPSRTVNWITQLPDALDPDGKPVIVRVTSSGQALVFAAEKKGAVRLISMSTSDGRLETPLPACPALPDNSGDLSRLRLGRTKSGEFVVLDSRIPGEIRLFRCSVSALGVPSRATPRESVKRK